MLLSEFNQNNESEIKSLLKQCVHIERWATEIDQRRPFDSKEELLAYASEQTKSWTWDEILAALNTHPRIGEKKAKVALSEKEQVFSDREQSALSQDEETLVAIYEGNVAYEKKYGYIFLIKASGLSSEEILTALKYRLANDPEIEKRIVHQQLLEIALLRLSQEVQA
ncbi:2-oxo-4-hydroxy-4-carboxy-5-ureidoimidazoline decarboxylase [Acinetobacter shaoyimingii]|uniref:2-oxo-4-hydroxy-4-carboxy-5-ureidoimidazoline decarboxylase n=1 Tax=Acinetobacter shaoyimingii TaxID=2715164 RepID=A0A6G8RZM0_9GAMM|nr:2-oxo-4-hydroxy-4-carboxy-5-ureidoimidazoline decarboxylase [Acinetobacter shaoyimingii]QIO07389.1 2-oxo-4-hydroxy-4-carboxy-5-ureidoimidazoline decarboxylase [Acinetobacter shaoyimingii]